MTSVGRLVGRYAVESCGMDAADVIVCPLICGDETISAAPCAVPVLQIRFYMAVDT